MKHWLTLLLATGAFAGSASAAPASLSGNLTIVGSDTASTLGAGWAVDFQAAHRAVRVQVQASGSASTPVALIEGAADIGTMSRAMNADERTAFERRHGHPPLGLILAHDAIAVFVHPDNPRTRITLVELDAIYSSDRRCGGSAALRRWDALPLPTGPALDGLPILAIGRDTGSGTNGLFREIALCGGRYQPQVIAWPGNGAVVAAVASNPEAIGYAGAGYANGLVRTLAVARDGAGEAVRPDEHAVASGRYPLSRALHVYVNRPPGEALAPLPAAFLDYVLSDAAQARVRGEGFFPLTAAERLAQKALLAP